MQLTHCIHRCHTSDVRIIDILIAFVLQFFRLTSLSASLASPWLPHLSMLKHLTKLISINFGLEQNFQRFPQTLTIANLESSSVCNSLHLQNGRIYPSLFTDFNCQAPCHPEFILRHDQIHWLSRTWIGRALQRYLHDGTGQHT